MKIVLDGQIKLKSSVLAMGMFDGVHIGHQVLLKRAKVLAMQQGVPLVVCTFTTHPLQIIRPEKVPSMITTLSERADKMEALGVDVFFSMPFDENLRDTLPEEYIANLVQKLNPSFIVAGYNHTFGKEGVGNSLLLNELGGVFGYRAQVVPRITLDGEEVSASAIRQLLAKGKVKRARVMLGAPYLRAATVAQYLEGGYALHMAPSGKQDVPKGVYRIVLKVNGKAYPATLKMKNSESGFVRFPLPLHLGDELLVRFYQEKESAS